MSVLGFFSYKDLSRQLTALLNKIPPSLSVQISQFLSLFLEALRSVELVYSDSRSLRFIFTCFFLIAIVLFYELWVQLCFQC